MLLGCGRKAPPTLPEKTSSAISESEVGEQDVSKETVAFLGGSYKEMKPSPSIGGFFGEMEYWSNGVMIGN
jgi:hypothetical protein